jgi:hypothetical protein
MEMPLALLIVVFSSFVDMSYSIYDYLQSFCFPHLQQQQQRPNEPVFEYRSSNMTSSQLEQIIRDIREFFAQRRLVYFTDVSSTDTYLFLSLSQLVWQSPNQHSTSMLNNLKPYFYPVPISLHKHYKHFFLDLLKIKIQLDGKDLLNIIEQIRKKYGTKPLDKDDFTLLQNVYTLLIEQYSNVFQSNMIVYLPNVDCVLHPGSSLFVYPFEREQMSKFDVGTDACLAHREESTRVRTLLLFSISYRGCSHRPAG